MLKNINRKIISFFKHNSVIKNSIIFTFFATINNGLNFLLIFFLSGYLSKENFGELNLFLTLILIFTTIIPLGTQGYISVIYYKKSKPYINKIINSIISLSFMALLFLYLVLFILPDNILVSMGIPLTYIYLAISICFFQVLYTTLLELFRLKEKPVMYGLLTLIFVLSNVLLTWALCVQVNLGWEGRAIAQFISSIFCFSLSLVYLRRMGVYIRLVFNKNHFTKITRFGLPLIPHSSTVWVRMGLDRYIINFFHGAGMLGSFSFIFNFSGLILMIGTAFNASNSVFIFKNLKNNATDAASKFKKQIKIMSLIFGIITIVSMFAIYLIIQLFLPKYIDSVPFIFPLCTAAFFQCIYYLFVNYIFYYKKTKSLMYITFSISILHLILSFFITQYSVVGLAYLSLFSNFLICICVMYYSNILFPLINIKRFNE